jgi:hypothetical protein
VLPGKTIAHSVHDATICAPSNLNGNIRIGKVVPSRANMCRQPMGQLNESRHYCQKVCWYSVLSTTNTISTYALAAAAEDDKQGMQKLFAYLVPQVSPSLLTKLFNVTSMYCMWISMLS